MFTVSAGNIHREERELVVAHSVLSDDGDRRAGERASTAALGHPGYTAGPVRGRGEDTVDSSHILHQALLPLLQLGLRTLPGVPRQRMGSYIILPVVLCDCERDVYFFIISN